MKGEMQTVVGFDAAILKKAEELVAISPDEPRGLREGTMFFSYKGHWLVQHNEGTMLWELQSVDGNPIPQQLQGKFTNRALALKLIDKWADPKQVEAGELILERKRIKLRQDIERQAKADTPQEWARLPVRAYEDSLKRKAEIDKAAADKATAME